MFGMYIVTSEVFAYMDEIVGNNLRSANGKFQFTPALARLAREEGILGVVVQGIRYDIGTPAKFQSTVRTFSEKAL